MALSQERYAQIDDELERASAYFERLAAEVNAGPDAERASSAHDSLVGSANPGAQVLGGHICHRPVDAGCGA